ncbi:UROD/MetE-like protein, partial [Metschnikowia bicuspidata]
FDEVVTALSDNQTLSVGIVDGRNIWKTDYAKASAFVNKTVEKLGKHRIVFATQKLDAVVAIAKHVPGEDVAELYAANAKYIKARQESSITTNPEVQKRMATINEKLSTRAAPFVERLAVQKEKYNLPLLPTTTIGSFPQTKDIRINRNKFAKGTITAEEYEQFINKEIKTVVRFQEEIGLDVLVHGEPERNDMMQYFGEQLQGYAFTNGWGQSYGSRYVRPPIIVGDLSRYTAMSVKESVYAQSLTKLPMKGMLTGPVTCLRWSFPRDDVSQKVQSLQLGLALRDEVQDLEDAGITVIQ